MGLFVHLKDGEPVLTDSAPQGEAETLPPSPSYQLFGDFDLYRPLGDKWQKVPVSDYVRHNFKQVLQGPYVIKIGDEYYCGNDEMYDRLGEDKIRKFSTSLFNRLVGVIESGLPFDKIFKQSLQTVLLYYWSHSILGGTFMEAGGNHEAKSRSGANLSGDRSGLSTQRSSPTTAENQKRLF